MLCFTRRRGESVIINHEWRVLVLEIKDGSVRLGFDFPREIPVHREEIERKIAEVDDDSQ